MADRRLLTDRFLRALPPAPKGQRVEVWDSRLKGFGVRVTDAVDADPSRRGKAGRISFILYARFGGAAPARRTIGIYGSTTLEAARRTAGEWRSQIAKGIDPAVVEAEASEKEARERAPRIKHSFGNAAEAFITDKLSQERSGKVWSAISGPASSPHGATGRSAKSPSSMCWRSSTPRSAPRRRWPARC